MGGRARVARPVTDTRHDPAAGDGEAPISELVDPGTPDPGPPAVRKVAIVPHTHWDREWYLPFQAFRAKLVRVVDELLDLLEHDPSYRSFLLDGQLAVVDDYLAVRPENEERLRALCAAGRITVGPWYVLMDEFLVSGETIVRNLQTGIDRAAAFGGAMPVGYLPDMFGHIAQMPQLLALAGIDHAVVWRGVPSSVTSTAFWWEAPDGSRVRTEYLPFGYGNGAAVPDDVGSLVRRLGIALEDAAPFLADDDTLLYMNGTDHQAPQPWLGRVVAGARHHQDRMALEITSLPAYLAGGRVTGLPIVRGELRSGYRANLLMGVTSNRDDVKRAASRAERAIERLAEPLSALFLPPDAWPQPFLTLAWRHLLHNSAHDSVCACSADDVVGTVLHRYAEARQIGETLTGEALDALGASMEKAGIYVVNPAARTRSGMVESVVVATGAPDANVQVLSERAGLPGSIALDAGTVRSLLGLVHGTRLDADTYVTDVVLGSDDTGVDVRITIGPEERDGFGIDELKRELLSLLEGDDQLPVRVHLDQPPVRRVLARIAGVPGFGWVPFDPAPLRHPVSVSEQERRVALDNGLVRVELDAATGTFSLDGTVGYGKLVDEGDFGDTYNYSPPAHDSTVGDPVSASVAVHERGPVRATAVVVAVYNWPDHVDPHSQARVGHRSVEVTTTVEMRADERLVRVRTAFVNPSRDHRLRVHLPLPEPADHSEAGSAFATVSRGLTAEGRPEEVGLPTFPARHFVSAGDLTVVHDGVVEYELVDVDSDGADGRGARTLALTVLRATGMLSRLGMANRPLPAGPLLPLEGPQRLGPVELSYGVQRGPCNPSALADDAFLPLVTLTSFGGGERPERGHALAVEGAEVAAVRRSGGVLEVRVCNPGGEPIEVTTAGRSGWLVDLVGRPLYPFSGSFTLRGGGIATFRLDEG